MPGTPGSITGECLAWRRQIEVPLSRHQQNGAAMRFLGASSFVMAVCEKLGDGRSGARPKPLRPRPRRLLASVDRDSIGCRPRQYRDPAVSLGPRLPRPSNLFFRGTQDGFSYILASEFRSTLSVLDPWSDHCTHPQIEEFAQ